MIGKIVSLAFEDLSYDTILCSFNPRHERIYRRMLNMQTIARRTGSESLSNAPSVLMRCDRETVPTRWLKSKAHTPAPALTK